MPRNITPLRRIELGTILQNEPLDKLAVLLESARKQGYRVSDLGRTYVNISRTGTEYEVPAIFLKNSIKETHAVIYQDSFEDRSAGYRLRECSFING